VRIISVTSEGLRLLKSFKAHEDAISKIRYSKDLRTLVTASVTGDIFFFDTDP
jgi:WD40 repeat protein